ncbi:hypothetical protein TD95_004380 [Thielaviopsis punctulata]|uniref:DUF8032 domain-containing protein n=1 Tax=Thielaviopsis punctulata TaxID=72032 RepID=A0A0F4ZF92_9PEZI|nr:hypothetical protein TD95_004380 [Thielaviopsis punctulata]
MEAVNKDRDSPSSDTPRSAHVFHGQYGSPYPSGSLTTERPADGRLNTNPVIAGPASAPEENRHDPPDLFPDLPDAKKRKFIIVEDVARRARLRVRATLENVDTREIPDSFRKGFSVFPRSYFPREMQSPPPSATGACFFIDDQDDQDDGIDATDGRNHPRGGRHSAARTNDKMTVRMRIAGREDVQVSVPRMRKSVRSREVRLNDLGHRMAWLQSRVFAGRPVFLQRALDCYRTKTLTAMDLGASESTPVSRLYQIRPGKKRWDDCLKRLDKSDD